MTRNWNPFFSKYSALCIMHFLCLCTNLWLMTVNHNFAYVNSLSYAHSPPIESLKRLPSDSDISVEKTATLGLDYTGLMKLSFKIHGTHLAHTVKHWWNLNTKLLEQVSVGVFFEMNVYMFVRVIPEPTQNCITLRCSVRNVTSILLSATQYWLVVSFTTQTIPKRLNQVKTFADVWEDVNVTTNRRFTILWPVLLKPCADKYWIYV